MPIAFPDFKNSHFCWITACGNVLNADENLAKWMEKEPSRTAPITTSCGMGVVELMISSGQIGNHVHFDVYSPQMASKKLSAAKSSVEDVQKSIERLSEKEIKGKITGGFQVPAAELPESGIIRSLQFKTKLANIGIRLNGASLSIEGAPIQNISWSQLEPNGDSYITITAEFAKTTISENYLTAASDKLQQAFDIFILGKAQK